MLHDRRRKRTKARTLRTSWGWRQMDNDNNQPSSPCLPSPSFFSLLSFLFSFLPFSRNPFASSHSFPIFFPFLDLPPLIYPAPDTLQSSFCTLLVLLDDIPLWRPYLSWHRPFILTFPIFIPLPQSTHPYPHPLFALISTLDATRPSDQISTHKKRTR